MTQRQEERLAQRLMVWVAGIDVRGNRFQQTARVVNVSRQGARLSEIRCLQRPGELLELKCRGKRAQFKVVWIDELAGEAGVRCLETGKDLWGIKLPTSRPAKYEPSKAVVTGPLGQTVSETIGGWISGTTPPTASPTGFCVGTTHGAQRQHGESGGMAVVSAPTPERRERQHVRHRCNGGAEVRRDTFSNGERIWGRITQLSLGGCYVAAMHPFAPETKVTLFIGVQDTEVHAKGVVRRSQPGVGMGIMFTEVDAQNQRGLQSLTTNLAKGGRFSQFA